MCIEFPLNVYPRLEYISVHSRFICKKLSFLSTVIRSSFTTDNGGNNSDSEPTNESSINNLPSPGVSDSSLENPRMDSTSSIPGIFVGSPGVPMMNGGEGSNNLSLIVGLAVGIPVAIVGILVMSLLLLFFRRSRMW